MLRRPSWLVMIRGFVHTCHDLATKMARWTPDSAGSDKKCHAQDDGVPRELMYLPLQSAMLARGSALVDSLGGSTLVLCSPAQLLVLALDRAAPQRSCIQPLEILRSSTTSRALGIVGIDTLHDAALLAIALSSQLGAEQEGHELVVASVPPEAATADAHVRIEARTLQLNFAPLIVQWLRYAESPTLVVSDANGGQLHVYAVRPKHVLAITELTDELSAVALAGLSLSLPSPTLALAEWSCGRTGWSARMLGCEDGTLEIAIGAPASSSGCGGALTRQRIRVERALNVAFFFAADGASVESAAANVPVVHLFVGSVLCGACVYTDVLSHALHAPVRVLPDSESVLCGAVWAARPNTILVGTWSRMLHCFRLEPASTLPAEGWQCTPVWCRELSHAVYAIHPFDLTNDGLDELVVRTLEGIHVLQEDLSAVCAELDLGLAILADGRLLESGVEAAGAEHATAARSVRTGALAELRERVAAARRAGAGCGRKRGCSASRGGVSS